MISDIEKPQHCTVPLQPQCSLRTRTEYPLRQVATEFSVSARSRTRLSSECAVEAHSGRPLGHRCTALAKVTEVSAVFRSGADRGNYGRGKSDIFRQFTAATSAALSRGRHRSMSSTLTAPTEKRNHFEFVVSPKALNGTIAHPASFSR